MNAPAPPFVHPRRRFRRRGARWLAILATLAVLVVARLWYSPEPLDPRVPLAPGLHVVVRVVDGDTIVVAPHERVRLIGVDTPETVKPEHEVEPYGPEASRFTEDFLAGGKARLTFDREHYDRYGRHLAYVWVGDRLLNEELLRAGLARWEPGFHYSEAMKRRFRRRSKRPKKTSAASGRWRRRCRAASARATRVTWLGLARPAQP